MLLVYFIKANAVLIALFAMYQLLFRRLKLLVVNRIVLVLMLAAAFLLPVLPGLSLRHTPGLGSVGLAATVQHVMTALEPIDPHRGHMDQGLLIAGIYGLVASVFFLRLLVHISRAFGVIQRSRKVKMGGLVYCEPAAAGSPFSFFRCIVIRRSQWTDETYRLIVSHEEAHCRQWHSVDMLLAELACVLLWLNPVIWLYRRQVNLQLEFLADESVTAAGADRKTYQLTLLHMVANPIPQQPVNGFHTPRIKDRIAMMNGQAPGSRALARYWLLLPMGMLLSLLAGSHPMTVDPSLTWIYVDARTELVRFELRPSGPGNAFNGIFVVDEIVYTAETMRNNIRSNGPLTIRLTRRPILGMYTENDADALRQWGDQARNGVIFIRTPLTTAGQ